MDDFQRSGFDEGKREGNAVKQRDPFIYLGNKSVYLARRKEGNIQKIHAPVKAFSLKEKICYQ